MILLFHKPLKVWPIVQRKCLCLISGGHFMKARSTCHFPHMVEFMIMESMMNLATEQNV